MLSLLIATSALLAIDPEAAQPAAPELPGGAAYEGAAARVGRDPDAHVRLALWCEAHGLDAERIKHLSLAVLKSPAHPLARGLLGLVSYRGRWQRPEAVAAAVGADPEWQARIAQYEEKRQKLTPTADAHWKLALWCEENGLEPQALAHLRSTVRLDPTREAAWKRLGYKKHKDGRWLTREQEKREEEEADLQKRADRKWKPILEKWRDMLAGRDPAKRQEAEQGLGELTDPRAVPMLWAVFAVGDEARQRRAVQVLGQIDSPGASRALAMLAVGSTSADVRRTATETLTRRDVREFANLLIALLRDPIQYEVRPVGGPGSPGAIFLKGKKLNVQRRYSPPSGPNFTVRPVDSVTYDANGLPVLWYNEGVVRTGRIPISALATPRSTSGPPGGAALPTPAPSATSSHAPHGVSPRAPFGSSLMTANQANLFSYGAFSGQDMSPWGAMMGIGQTLLDSGRLHLNNGLQFDVAGSLVIPVGQMAVEAQKTAVAAQQQLQNDVAAIDRYNEGILEGNRRALPVLREVSGQDLGEGREGWARWWIDQIGYTIKPDDPSQSQTQTVVQDVPLDYQPQPLPLREVGYVVGFRQMSCFGAGTLVQTLTGPRPIETLRIGDEVLAQDVATGALAYQPILVVHHNPPSKTFRIALGGETVVSSEFHRFWKADKGWVMARDLKAGDRLRTLDGLVTVDSIESGTVQPVFNLDVAEAADFFVGTRGALVHDNTLPDLRLVPFDATPALAEVSAR
jgi:hypothetical protein